MEKETKAYHGKGAYLRGDYVIHRVNGGCGRKGRSRRCERDWYSVKWNTNGTGGISYIRSYLYVPLEHVGDKFRLKVEWIKDEPLVKESKNEDTNKIKKWAVKDSLARLQNGA